MPKVYSRAVISSSDQARATQSSRAVLRSYYCLCGDFLLVLQGSLERLPRRKTDGSYIIRTQPSASGIPARKFKLNAQPGQRALMRRPARRVSKLKQAPEPASASAPAVSGSSGSADTTRKQSGPDGEGDATIELYQPFRCSRCNTTVAYQTHSPPAGSGPFLYVLKGSMTETQGRIPPDAFEGEVESE